MPVAIWTGADALLTNDDARILAIGNPDDPTSEFAKVCKGSPDDGSSGMSDLGWWVITISAFETPNFTDEPVPDELRPYLTGRTWVEERRTKWGETSPLWISKPVSLYPPSSASPT